MVVLASLVRRLDTCSEDSGTKVRMPMPVTNPFYRILSGFGAVPAARPKREKLSKNWAKLEKEVEYLVHDEVNFIVFIDHDLDVDWETTNKLDSSFEKKASDAKKNHYNVLAQAAVVETMPSDGLDIKPS
jgi:hypothetical protein